MLDALFLSCTLARLYNTRVYAENPAHEVPWARPRPSSTSSLFQIPITSETLNFFNSSWATPAMHHAFTAGHTCSILAAGNHGKEKRGWLVAFFLTVYTARSMLYFYSCSQVDIWHGGLWEIRTWREGKQRGPRTYRWIRIEFLSLVPLFNFWIQGRIQRAHECTPSVIAYYTQSGLVFYTQPGVRILHSFKTNGRGFCWYKVI